MCDLSVESSAEYTLVRHHKRWYFQVDNRNGLITRMSNTVIDGVGVRCLKNGSWGFACSTDPGDLCTLVKKAEKAAESSAAKKKHKTKIGPAPTHTGEWVSPVKEPVTDANTEEIIQFLKETDTRKEYPGIISQHVSFLTTIDSKELATSGGTHINQKEYRIFCTAAVTAKVSGRIATTNNAVGGQVGTEIFAQDDLKTVVKEESERALRLAPAAIPPGGRYKVVLAPEVASVLIHEAVGHTAEADVVAGGSYLSGELGKRVASDCVTLIDDGLYPHGFGTYKFDDEGILSQKTVIIEKGYLRNYLHSRETSDTSTGNARAWLYSREPQVRMTNTYLEPQDYSLEELIEDVGSGLLLRGITSGLADHSGNFTLYIPEAQKIEHKKLTDTISSGVTVSANAFDLLSQLHAVGDKTTFQLISGVCGKSETAFVGMGAPAVATSVVVGGQA